MIEGALLKGILSSLDVQTFPQEIPQTCIYVLSGLFCHETRLLLGNDPLYRCKVLLIISGILLSLVLLR